MHPEWLPHDEFPFEERWREIDGNRISYIDKGSGPCLLFVHAGPTWSFVFRGLIDRLGHDFRCVALDFPGTGLSPAPAGYRPTMRGAAGLLRRFVAELDLKDFTLVVNDLGGPVAVGGLGTQYANTIRGMVATEAFGWSLATYNPKVARILRTMGSPAVVAIVAVTNLMALFTSTRFGVGRHLSRAGRKAFRGPYRDRLVRRNALAILADGARDDLFLQEVDNTLRTCLKDRPLLTIFGEKSPAVKEGFPAQWKTRFPGARQLLVDGGHHFPQMDDADLVSEAIRNWWHECVEPSVGSGRRA